MTVHSSRVAPMYMIAAAAAGAVLEHLCIRTWGAVLVVQVTNTNFPRF